MLCLLISSDGVWDNWEYQDVQEFIMYNKCLELIKSNPDRTQNILESFMNRNNIYATHNFGNNADNATSSITYIYT